MVAPEYGGDNVKRAEAGKYPDPLVAFPGHWAPLQMAFYNGDAVPGEVPRRRLHRLPRLLEPRPAAAEGLQRGLRALRREGHAARRPTRCSPPASRASPSSSSPKDAQYRPAGLAFGPDGSMYVSETEKGRVWRIFYTGEQGARHGGGQRRGAVAARQGVASARGRSRGSPPRPAAAAPAADTGPGREALPDRLRHLPHAGRQRRPRPAARAGGQQGRGRAAGHA